MIRYYCGVAVFTILIVLFTPSFGRCSVQRENQEVLAFSKIRKKNIKQVLNDIKRTLPKQLKECPIIVTDIKLLKQEDERVWEDWTVDVCQEKKIYFIDTYAPKRYCCTVMTKEEALIKEKPIWKAAKKHADEEYWRNKLPHIADLEAMDQIEKKQE